MIGPSLQLAIGTGGRVSLGQWINDLGALVAAWAEVERFGFLLGSCEPVLFGLALADVGRQRWQRLPWPTTPAPLAGSLASATGRSIRRVH